MSVDLRTRTDGPRTPVHAGSSFAELPALLDERHALIGPGLQWLTPRPLAIETPDGSWTLTGA